MKKTSFFLLLSLLLINSLNAQFFTGGNFSINYANGIFVEAAPEIGYRFIEKIDVGTSPFLSYSKINGAPKAVYSYGGRVFTRVTVANGVYATGSFEAMNSGFSDSRQWIYALPVGGGVRYSFGQITFYSEIMYDVLLDKDSPRENPVVRGGVNYSF